MAVRLIIFDLDGTLAETLEDLAEAVNAVRGARGLPPLDLASVRGAVGEGARSLVARTVGPGEAPLREFLERYADHCLDRTRLRPGAREVLEATRDRIRAVLTNKPEAVSRRILDALGVGGHFADVVGGDTFPTRKPDPAGVLALLGRHALPPGEALLVGDSPIDVATARAAGIASAGILGGYAEPGSLEAAKPDLLLPGLEDLLGRLG